MTKFVVVVVVVVVNQQCRIFPWAWGPPSSNHRINGVNTVPTATPRLGRWLRGRPPSSLWTRRRRRWLRRERRRRRRQVEERRGRREEGNCVTGAVPKVSYGKCR